MDWVKEDLDAALAKRQAELNAETTARSTSKTTSKAGTPSETTSGSTSDSTQIKPKTDSASDSTSGSTSKTPDPEMVHLIELTPRLRDVIIDMWNTSALRQGFEVVAQATEIKYGARLASLSRAVYSAYTKSEGSPEALTELITRHAPQQTTPQSPQTEHPTTPTTPPTPQQTVIVEPEGPKSGSNQPSQAVSGPNGVPSSVAGGVPSGADDNLLKYVTPLPPEDA